MTDQQIICLLRTDQNHKATRRLYEYYPQVRKFILANQGKLEDAQDIFHEAIMFLCHKIVKDELVIKSTLEKFMFYTCRNKWNHVLRKRKCQVLPRDEFDDVFTEYDDDLEQKYKNAERALVLVKGICHKLMHLAFIEQVPIITIVEIFKFSSQQIARTRKAKCLESAKKIFQELTNTNTDEQ